MLSSKFILAAMVTVVTPVIGAPGIIQLEQPQVDRIDQVRQDVTSWGTSVTGPSNAIVASVTSLIGSVTKDGKIKINTEINSNVEIMVDGFSSATKKIEDHLKDSPPKFQPVDVKKFTNVLATATDILTGIASNKLKCLAMLPVNEDQVKTALTQIGVVAQPFVASLTAAPNSKPCDECTSIDTTDLQNGIKKLKESLKQLQS